MMMEENLSYRRRKSIDEKSFTKKQVDELMKEKQNQLEVQYSVLKELYENYER